VFVEIVFVTYKSVLVVQKFARTCEDPTGRGVVPLVNCPCHLHVLLSYTISVASCDLVRYYVARFMTLRWRRRGDAVVVLVLVVREHLRLEVGLQIVSLHSSDQRWLRVRAGCHTLPPTVQLSTLGTVLKRQQVESHSNQHLSDEELSPALSRKTTSNTGHP